ncbi:hypothetical protein [Streptomyces sp. ICC4]|uniref:hypothetical protein n=1 Tax=Streptomyces sp. ICC4 TaxID=2099584 RepID=UPI0013A6E6D2|nr:hypothetical protein [Streptomyces sp. ICC4]
MAGTKAGKGTTVYPGAAPSTDLAVQATPGGGVRALAVLEDKSAPRQQRYLIGLPTGAGLVKTSTGMVAAVGPDGQVLGAFATPWAKDANGKSVPTSYQVEGNTLVQSVQTTGATAFPVVADPWYDPSSWENWDTIKCVASQSQDGAIYAGAGAALAGPEAIGPGAVGGALAGTFVGLKNC